MPGFYLRAYRMLPSFLRHRINPLEFAIEEFVAEAVRETPRMAVLDAGAGESRFAPHFARHFYVALDSGVGDREWNYGKVTVWGDLAALPVASRRVDLVVNTQVLEHVRSPQKVLAEFFRVLKPGGKLFLTAPQGWHEHQQPHDYYRFTRFALEMLLRQAGFGRFRVEPLGGYFHYLGQRLTYVPKVLFQERSGVLRAVLFPLELVCLAFFCLILPVACYYLDRFDRKREFTLGYKCVAVK